MKKLMATILILALLLPCLGALAEEEAREALTYGDYQYILLDNGTAEITKYTGTDKELIIPDLLDGCAVTSIGKMAFANHYMLTSVTIPESVTIIGDSAFSSCYMLTSVTIPDGVKTIGGSAFFLCSSLTSITIPDGVTAIGDEAFSNCSLTSVAIPDSVTEMGINPFTGSKKLTEITVSPDHPYLGTINGVLFSKPDQRLICYPCAFSASMYDIPQGIQVIGDKAFAQSSLTSVTIPDSVTEIVGGAFFDCSSLTSVIIADSVAEMRSNPFIGCDSLTNIAVSPDHPYLATIDGVLFSKPDQRLICYPCSLTASTYDIPQGIQAIGDSAFYGCSSLTSVTFPDSVTAIEDAAFYMCLRLASVAIPNSVTAIGEAAFSMCSNLASVTIPDSVTSIGGHAFLWCSNKITLTVGQGSYTEQYCIDNGLNYQYAE